MAQSQAESGDVIAPETQTKLMGRWADYWCGRRQAVVSVDYRFSTTSCLAHNNATDR